MREEKGWEETGGTQVLLILLNFSEATYDENPCANREKSRNTTES